MGDTGTPSQAAPSTVTSSSRGGGVGDDIVGVVEGTEDPLFSKESVNSIIQESIESALTRTTVYAQANVALWTNQILENTLRRLTVMNKPYKYIVSCLIMQKNGAGLHTASACFWDTSSDASVTHRWENKSIYCITTVYGLSI
ncbi:flagellar inner arm dynein light chain Tctex1 [Pelomyxa schiedti]|nr:flagellar inner arm dynein light chain Tctex1 [Pelomyxa schiedti]